MKKFYWLLFTCCLLPAVYCLAQGTWTRKADFGGFNRIEAVGFSIGTKGYIGTGADSTYALRNDFWEYDQSSDTWTQKADFIGLVRKNAVGFSIGTKGYIGTGLSSSNLNDFYEWDQAANTWTQKNNFPGAARGSAVGFSIGTKGYIGTGLQTQSPPPPIFFNDFWEWNQATDTWTQKASFGGNKRDGAVGFSISTKGYIGTGGDTGYYKDFWEWDQASNTWTQKASFGGVQRRFAVGFSIPQYGKGYIGTGDNANNLNDFWEWDQASNTWTQKANFSGAARSSAVGFSIGNKGYIGTGASSSTVYYKDFWEFDDGLGISESELENSISVFPNPTTGKINLRCDNNSIHVNSTEVYSIKGEKINSYSSSGVNISEQPAGIYFLNIKTDKGSVVKKIVKE